LGHLEIEYLLENPDAFDEPWIIKRTADLAPKEDLLEYVCNENERDRTHIVRK